MLLVASPYINWSALWKIALASLIGGAGVVIVFGFLLLGVKIANNAKSGGREWAGYALSGVCGLFCVAVVAAGIYAILNKPASKKPAKPAKSALVVPSRTWS
jgi:hypothetical protein